MHTKDYYDITIIGGGPVGMFAATYARMRLAKTQIIESLDQLGGQVQALFPSKKIYDIPAFPAVTGSELVQQLEKQLEHFSPDVFLGETVEGFTKVEDGFEIKTSKRTTYSKTIIIATGAGAFEPRKLKLANASDFEGSNLHYLVTDIEKFRGKDLAIAGGGDSAIDWALELAPIANSIHLIHRRDKFRALEANIVALKQTDVIFQTPYLISELADNQGKLKLTLNKVRSDETKELTVDHLLVNYGFSSSSKAMEAWQLTLENRGIKTNIALETSTSGIYAIGDIAQHEGKLDLMATGFGEAPTAVDNALLYIYPDKHQPAHSTQLIKKFEEAQN